jgi:zinc D-Ala-D-Ala dipeptidase
MILSITNAPKNEIHKIFTNKKFIMLHNLKTSNLFLTLAIICFVLLNSCATKPPCEKGNFKESELVELIKIDSAFKLDIRYATANNFVHTVVYSEARAFLQKPAAFALVKANAELKRLGYGIVIFDGYRPWSVTKIFWDLTPDENKKFVADPKVGSRHNRGCAIDITLYEISSGRVVQMTSEYDEATERSYPYYAGGTSEQRRLRDLLRTTMEANGFTVNEFEWWHFDYKDWEKYRIENIPFSEIK